MQVLVAEDDFITCHVLEGHLTRWGYDVIAAHDGEARRLLLAETAPRLAVLDRVMPKLDGAAVCRTVRASKRDTYTYIIMLSALAEQDDLLVGMQAGADDYITKPFQVAELEARLRVGRRLIEQQDQLIAAREALRIEATHDALTGLLNHEEIIRLLELELTRAERYGRHVGVIMADLDHFKAVNDVYGHLVGDEILRMTAKEMATLLRPYDFLGRYGGEEFLVVLPEISLESVVGIAERLRGGINSATASLGEALPRITGSFGVALGGGEERGTARILIDVADRALYRAKYRGRNRVEVSKVARAA